MKDLEHTTEEDFDKIMALNVRGPYFLAQVCGSLPPASNALTETSPESSPTYATRLPHRPPLNYPMHGVNHPASLPAL